MNFNQISGGAAPKFTQADADYVHDDGQFAIRAHGHFTIAELEFLIDQLKDVNTHWKPAAPAQPRDYLLPPTRG